MNVRLLLIGAVILSFSCKAGHAGKEYGYVFHESTGQNQYILVDAKEEPFRFDEQKSDKLALGSLRSLSARVLYPNSRGNKIFLVGDYDSRSQSFVLTHWYIKVPFTELTLEDRLQRPEEIRNIERRSLERTDFEPKQGFDPNSETFNPKDHEKDD